MRGRIQVLKLFASFIYDLSNEYERFFIAFRMTRQTCFCHSERAFGRGRIPALGRRVEVLKLFTPFIYDLSNEYARFFTAFRMTGQTCFFHSERAFWLGRIPALGRRVEVLKLFTPFIYYLSNEYVRFFNIVQNDRSNVFLSF
jgi:hypothetical protein